MAQIDTADEAQQQPPRVYAEDFPEAVVDGVEKFLGKPRARGWIHVYSAVVAFIAGAALVSVSWALESTRAGLATLLYTITIVAMFAVSGTYHRVNWKSQTARKWMKRADHSMIFVFIAGTYTPFALLRFEGRTQWLVLILVWLGAALGLVLELVWIDSPRWLSTVAYLLVGWVGVLTIPQLFTGAGVAVAVLLLVGGGLYSLGAVIYAIQWPNPFPRVLGFHEVFHLLVVAAAAMQFVAVSLVVM